MAVTAIEVSFADVDLTASSSAWVARDVVAAAMLIKSGNYLFNARVRKHHVWVDSNPPIALVADPACKFL